MSPQMSSSSSAASVQEDVDSQIEIEMRRLDEAARAMDAERATRRARDERTAADAEFTTHSMRVRGSGTALIFPEGLQ